MLWKRTLIEYSNKPITIARQHTIARASYQGWTVVLSVIKQPKTAVDRQSATASWIVCFCTFC